MNILKLFIVLICTGLLSCKPSGADKTTEDINNKPANTVSKETAVKRGEYLVTIAGCHDCHSPKKFGPNGPQPDPERLLSGHPQDMPLAKVDTSLVRDWAMFNNHMTATVGLWGVSYSANITSDATGIGNWTEEQFFRALKEGKYKGLANNRMLLPPMPWPMFSHMEDEDIKAIFAYLKTVKPVKNVPPQPKPLSEISSL
jgi:mono/diheme cytochrome c family protein